MQKHSRPTRTARGFLLATLLLGLVPVLAVPGCSSQAETEAKPIPDRLKKMRDLGRSVRPGGQARPAGGAPSTR
jgi:hypothetical protein